MSTINRLMTTFHGIILSDYSKSMLGGVKMLGHYKLASILRKLGYNILVIDLYSDVPKAELLSILEKSISSETLFVGYSTTMFFGTLGASNANQPSFFPKGENLFIEINQTVKKLNPNLKILLGGAGSRYFMSIVNKTEKNFLVDYVMHGYSENMIVDFVYNLTHSKPQKFSNKVRNVYEIDYDYLGTSHDFRHDDLKPFSKTDFISPKEYLSLEVARGCIFKCKFCSYPLLGKDPTDTSYIRTEENLLSEVLYNYDNFRTQSYLIVDDTFNERNEKIELLLRVRDRSKLDLNFVGYNRIELIHTKNQYALLKDLNFNGMFFGIESLNYPSAKVIGKGIRSEKIIETLYKLKDQFNNKLIITAGFIIGLPHETRDTLDQWTQLIFKDDFPIDNFSFAGLGIKKADAWGKSEFSKNPEKYGYVLPPPVDLTSWKNEHWTSGECAFIAGRINNQLYNSGRQRFGAFQLPVYSKFGFTFDDLLGKSINSFDSITDSLNKTYIDEYVTYLKSITGDPYRT